jgi:hypothetical protein
MKNLDLCLVRLMLFFSQGILIIIIIFIRGFWEIFNDAENEIGFTELADGARRMLNIAL